MTVDARDHGRSIALDDVRGDVRDGVCADSYADTCADTCDENPVDVPDPRRLLQWLTAYDARVTEAAARLGERQCRRWQMPFPQAAHRASYRARDAWLGPCAPIAAFASRANRLALLDAASLRRVLAARALYPSRGGLRRIVSGTCRAALAHALGEHALASLGQMGVTARAAGAPLPDDLAPDALARAGRALFERDDGWALAPARRLIGAMLDDEGDDNDAFLPAARDAAAETDARSEKTRRGESGAVASPSNYAVGESADFLRGAGMLFPELTWLFG